MEDEQAANALFVEALQHVEAAGRATSSTTRLDLLRQAQANLDRIVQDHPGSQLAVQLITGQRIGAFDPRVFADTLAEAEEDRICAEAPDACTLFADALATAGEIPMHAYRAEALAEISAEQLAAGLTRSARQSLAESLATIRETPWIWQGWHFADALATIAAAQAGAGLADDARRTFAHAVTATDEINSREERGAALMLISVTQAEAGLVDDALITAGGIDSRNCRFRPRALAAIGTVLAQAGQIENARRTMEEAVAAGEEPQCLEGGYRTDPPLAIAVAQVAAGFREDAQRSFAEALTRARADGILVWGRVAALAEIAAAQASSEFTDDALRTLTEALAEAADRSAAFITVEVLLDIVAAQTASGQLEDALTSASELRRGSDRAYALAVIGSERHAAGYADEARQIFAEAVVAAANTAGRDHRAEELAAVATAQAEAGWPDDALATVGDMPQDGWPGFRIEALAAIGAAKAADGDLDEARRTFAIAQATTNDIRSDEISHSEALLLVAKAQVRAAAAILTGE